MKHLLLALLPLTAVLLASASAQKKNDQLGPRTEVEILKSVKLPEGFEATVFAQPPGAGYPTSVSAAIDGTIFVAIDENGSLGRERNLAPNNPTDPKRRPGNPGRVVRMRDLDGGGRADEFRTFAEMESPRGVIWDGNGMGADGKMPGTLYVMYPPKLSAFTDTDGDGSADKVEDIVTGLGFGLDFRGADHTTNGCRLAIDGFIYIAVGDYGFTKAVAKDGTTLSMRGGGIVRVRPDGTGFEIVSRGQRNIYDVAISPTLDLFTRDNTNDGGGWNVRLSHVPPGAHMGYPTLFKNFPEDMVPALADFGGGSPCGALWIDEPGLPGGLFTVEWGSNAIMHHPLKPKGAGWELDPTGATDPKLPGQVKWLGITRPTDMDVDAAGRIYITSWEGATFTYNGPNAGYVVRVVKKGAPAASVVDLGKANANELVKLVLSRSDVTRLAAHRELLRRTPQGDREALAGKLIEAGGSARPLPLAVAAIFTAEALAPQSAIKLFSSVRTDLDLGEYATVALANRTTNDRRSDFDKDMLGNVGARARAVAIIAARRLGAADTAPHILSLVADEDPVVRHLAIGALRELKAATPLLAALDSADERVKPGALQALYGIYEPTVVKGLIARLSGAKGEHRKSILNALCRLANQDQPYTDPKVWWGTRPDTSGPVYKPVAWSESGKIEAALKTALDASSDDDARWLVQRMYLTKVNFPGLIELMLTKAGSDTAAKLTAIEGMFRPDNSIPAEAAAALKSIALSEKETPDLRAKALRHLARGSGSDAIFPIAVETFATFAGHDIGQPALTAAFEDWTRDAKNTKRLGDFAKLASSKNSTPAQRTLAQTVLVNLATSALVKGKDKEAADAAMEKAWAQPEFAASLLGVIARTGAKVYAEQVKARLKDPNNAVAEAALFAFQKLGLSDTAGAPAQTIASLPYEAVFAAVQKGGDAEIGKDLYLRAGCIACHTITADEPPRGPVLNAVAKMYDRAALTESILKPNAKLAQGFESAFFKTKKGEQIEGFITREGGDSLDVRNIVGQTVTLDRADIAERGHRPQSMMPEGLMNGFTPNELAHMLAWLESLRK